MKKATICGGATLDLTLMIKTVYFVELDFQRRFTKQLVAQSHINKYLLG